MEARAREARRLVPGDRSNGYDAVCAAFMSLRSASSIGTSTVAQWVQRLPRDASVLDLGCGHGLPVSGVLDATGCDVYGVDASPRLVAAFRDRFPQAKVACETVEESSFFGRTFDGIVAVGLIFLLPGDVQVQLINRMAAALTHGGHLVFTAPEAPSVWPDALTGTRSTSLGAQAYRRLLGSAGLSVDGHDCDDGHNHYYFASKPRSPRTPITCLPLNGPDGP